GGRSVGPRGARDRGGRRGRGPRHFRGEPAGRSGARDHAVASGGVHRPPRERGLAARWPAVGGPRGGRHGRAGVRLCECPPVAALSRGGPRAVRGHPHRYGRVRFANTTPRVLRVAGALLEHGVDPETIYESVYASAPEGRVRLTAEVLSTLVVEPERGLAWVTVPPDALQRHRATADDLDGTVQRPR